MKELIEQSFGTPDADAHYLYKQINVSNKIAIAISFHIIAASRELDIFESKKYLNKFTLLCVDAEGLYVKQALQNYYCDQKFQGIYNYSKIPSSISYGQIFEKVDEILDSNWCSYVAAKMLTSRTKIQHRWNKIKKLDSSLQDTGTLNERVQDVAIKAQSKSSGPLFSRRDLLDSRELFLKALDEFEPLIIVCGIHSIYAAAGKSRDDCLRDFKSNKITKSKKIVHEGIYQSGRYSGFYKRGRIFVDFLDKLFLQGIKDFISSSYAKDLIKRLNLTAIIVLRWFELLLEFNEINPSNEKSETENGKEGFMRSSKPKRIYSVGDFGVEPIGEIKPIEEVVKQEVLDLSKKEKFVSKKTTSPLFERKVSEFKKISSEESVPPSAKGKEELRDPTGPMFEKNKIEFKEKSFEEVLFVEEEADADSLVDFTPISESRTLSENKIDKVAYEAVGLDWSSHCLNKAFSYWQDEKIDFKSVALQERSVLPSCILPSWGREKVLVDFQSPCNRKGMGLLWPPEAQVPVNEDLSCGTGRIPLVAVQGKIQAESLEDEWRSYFTSSFHWKPDGKSNIRVDAFKLMATAIKAYGGEFTSLALSIPDGFTEGAQQALLESTSQIGLGEHFLVPRSVCMAMKWCYENQDLADGNDIEDKNGVSLGYLLTVSLGMDLWEVKLLEIRAVEDKGQNYLIPIYDPSTGNTSLDLCGLSLCKDMLKGEPDYKVWRALHGSDWFKSCLEEGCDSGLYDSESVRQSLLFAKSQLVFKDLDLMEGLSRIHDSKVDIKERLKLLIKRQLQALKISSSKILGSIVCGAFANLELDEEMKIADFLCNDLGRYGYSVASGNSYIAKGATLAAHRIEYGLPSYRTKLVPVDIFTAGKSSKGDKEIKWVPLIEADTVEAGQKYEPIEPIKGLSIPAGASSLDLTLRRPSLEDDYIYRNVKAHLSEETFNKEEVKIYVSAKPGQGFSQVSVLSAVPGVFNTLLDWRSMQEAEEPQDLLLEYIPNVSYIEVNRQMFENAEYDFIRFKDALRLNQLTKSKISSLRERLNQWPRVVSDSNLKSSSFDDLFKHKGVLNSNGSFDGVEDPFLVQEVVDSLDAAFKKSKDESLHRLGAWFYQLVPASILNHTIDNFREGYVSQVDLHTAGLCFHSEEHLKLFFEAFYNKCISSNEGFSEWFRSLRNIVRFQDHALSPKVLSDKVLNTILEELLITLNDRISYNSFTSTLNNCLQASLFILKRRRYDEGFLAEGEQNTLILEQLLKKCAENHQSKIYRGYAEAALKFLHKKATAQDASKVLESS